MKKTFFALVLLLSGSLIACNENEPEAEMKEPEKEKTVMTVEMQQQMTPRQALDKLMEGNARFLEGGRKDIDYLAQVETTATGQYPYAVILNCIDSRTPAEIFFDQGVGDIFHARIAGNFVNTDIL
ncbi:MAG: carbonic anhydrase, partial [Candidatus Kapaibacterium sp.]